MTTEVYQIAIRPRAGYYRWVICALLFFAATINHIDRQVIGILKPTLVQEFQWQDGRIYAAIVFSFQLAYAIGPPLVALYLVPDIGRLGGGWISSALIKRACTVNAARKAA